MTNPITSALGWIEGTALGTVATAVAVVAAAWVGFLMLSGRIDIRRAAHVVFGCFIIFGASTIAAGIQAAIFGTPELAPEEVDVTPPPPPAFPTAPANTDAAAYDPYAGAGLSPSDSGTFMREAPAGKISTDS